MNKVKKALELAPLKDLESHQKYCKLVGSMLPEECRHLTAALAATPNQPPAPFALVWDGQMGSLRRRDGFTIIATMSERTYKRIKQAQDDGADFYTLKAMFPKKHSVYNA